MSDYFEIDFLDVESAKSGDAIPLRYELNGTTTIHVVDGGFTDTGSSVVKHIKRYYGDPAVINRVVVTHPDGDHACGLQTVLEEFKIGELWMLRPWLYAEELLDRFKHYSSAENLAKRLKECYPYIAALEQIAIKRGIPIREPFQSAMIGAFTVMAPSKSRYLDLIVTSEKTPESADDSSRGLGDLFKEAVAKVAAFIKAAWGHEVFSPDETSAENEMSVIQYALLCNERILLTADAGRAALTEAADHASTIGLSLPGINRFQVPHHGSRRNVSTGVLDRWLGQRLPQQSLKGTFTAVCSSAKLDKDHPRKSVIRAIIHRGGNFYATEGRSIRSHAGAVPSRGWSPLTPSAYPEDQEE